MTEAEAEEFSSHPQAQDAVALRRWDEAARKPGEPGLPLSELLLIFARYRRAQELT